MNQLRKNDVRFKWTKDAELFVVRQYAEFINPLQICRNVADEFIEYCEKDMEKHGEEVFLKYLLRRVYDLSPKRKHFPKKYREPFEDFRKSYLNDLESSYLSHRRNRLRELDILYQNMANRLVGEEDGQHARSTAQTCLSILREARVEMDTSKVTIEAEISGENARVAARRHLDVSNLTTGEIKALMEQHESGKSIGSTDGDTVGGVLSDTSRGVSEKDSSGSSTTGKSNRDA